MLIVTATDLPRLLACNGSRLMGGYAPPISAADDTVRDEGNAADWVVAQVFNGYVRPEELIDCKAPNGVYITAEMIEYLDEYLKAVGVQDHTRPESVEIEYANSYGNATWQVNGRADLIKYNISKKHLDIGDLKYGWGIVEPEMNWTLLSHLFGFIAQNPNMPVETATLTIYQPRPHHHLGPVRSSTIHFTAILRQYNEMRWKLENLNDQLHTGEHCYKCPALAVCPAARNAQMNAIEASEKVYNDNIDNDKLSFELTHLERAAEIIKQRRKAYEEMALYRIKQGQIVTGYGVETGLSNRELCDFVTAEWIEALTGKDLTKKKLPTPAQMEKAGVHKDVVASMTTRHKTGAKLVKVDANSKAEKMFNNPKGK